MYQMPVRAIKNILKKELEERKQSFFNAYPSFIMSDTQKEMIYLAYAELSGILEKCNDYASLEDFISYSGYRMSLQEWIESL
jgi:hypothetical protein